MATNNGKTYSHGSLFQIYSSHPRSHDYNYSLVSGPDCQTNCISVSRFHSSTSDTLEVVKYLQEKYLITTPENFAEILHKERMVFFSRTMDTVPLKTIDAIIEACKIWLPYIAPESFSALVCEQVKDMFRIHAAAICYTISGKEINACIENVVPLVKTPPIGLNCCVSYNGRYAIDGVYQ